MEAGAAIAGALIGLSCLVAIFTLVGAIILRAAVSVFNKMAGGAGSPSAVPEPNFGKALGVTFITMLVNVFAGFFLGLVVGGAAAAAGQRGGGATVMLAQLISFPMGFLVMAGMLSALLPTTFGRAAVVTLCYYVIFILILIFVGVIIGVVGAVALR